MRSWLCLEVHIVNVLLLLEGGAHGRRLRRPAIRTVTNGLTAGGLSAASGLRLLLIIVVLGDCRRWISQILKLHRIVSLHLEQALAFEEVLAPLESRLLLHLLERGRIRCHIRSISRHILPIFRKVRIVVCQHWLIGLILRLLLIILIILTVLIIGA